VNTIFRVLVVGLLALACVKLHEIAQHTRLAGAALALIAISGEPPREAPRPTPRTSDRVVRNSNPEVNR